MAEPPINMAAREVGMLKYSWNSGRNIPVDLAVPTMKKTHTKQPVMVNSVLTIFLHNTLAHDIALPYQVWYQSAPQFRRYHPDKHSLTFWTFAVTLIAVTQFLHSTLGLMMLYYQSNFDCKWTSSFEDIVEIIISWLCKPSLWPWHWR